MNNPINNLEGLSRASWGSNSLNPSSSPSTLNEDSTKKANEVGPGLLGTRVESNKEVKKQSISTKIFHSLRGKSQSSDQQQPLSKKGTLERVLFSVKIISKKTNTDKKDRLEKKSEPLLKDESVELDQIRKSKGKDKTNHFIEGVQVPEAKENESEYDEVVIDSRFTSEEAKPAYDEVVIDSRFTSEEAKPAYDEVVIDSRFTSEEAKPAYDGVVIDSRFNSEEAKPAYDGVIIDSRFNSEEVKSPYDAVILDSRSISTGGEPEYDDINLDLSANIKEAEGSKVNEKRDDIDSRRTQNSSEASQIDRAQLGQTKVLGTKQARNHVYKMLKVNRELKDGELSKVAGEAFKYMKAHGRATQKLAIKTGEYQVTSLSEQHKIIFKPSGKIYLSSGQLGEGGFKTTYKAWSSAGAWHAISVSRNNLMKASAELNMERELNLELKAYKRANADLSNVNMCTSVSAEGSNQFVMASQLLDGDVDHLLGRAPLSKQETLKVISEMAKGIMQLHGVGIIHRDVKPSNFLFKKDEGQIVGVKINDFGVSTSDSVPHLKFPVKVMDTDYKPLEIKGDQSNHYSKAIDIYQLGICIYQLQMNYSYADYHATIQRAIGELNNPNDRREYVGKISEWKKTPEKWEGMGGIEEPIKGFMLNMLSTNPAERPSAEEVFKFFSQLQE